MDNNFNDGIRQGFLCPFCLQDFGDPSNLLNHVEVYHRENVKSDVVEHIKDLFGKAKQKIKVFDNVDNSEKSDKKNDEIIQQRNISLACYPEHQDIGHYRSYQELFSKERDTIVKQTTEDTNQLIIRLDKLITGCPDDPHKRKDFEREVVPWTPDKDSNKCGYCNITFNITKRKHHCRLCGKVICALCSKFLSFITARKLINPAFAAQILSSLKNVEKRPNEQETEKANLFSSLRKISTSASIESFNKMKAKSGKLFSHLINKDDAEGSLSSLIIQDENEQFRICLRCKELLEKRDMIMDQIATTPIIIQLYETLICKLKEVKNLVPSYCKMAESLNEGENHYTLDGAIQLRKKLAFLQKDVDMISSKIEHLGENDVFLTTKPTVMELKLQKSIRRYAIMVVQDSITDMPTLPSEKLYMSLQEENKKRMLQKIENEKAEQKRLSQMSSSHSTDNFSGLLIGKTSNNGYNKSMSTSPSNSGIKHSKTFVDSYKDNEGWTPQSLPQSEINRSINVSLQEKEKDEDKTHALQQQYLIIKEYLKQAGEAGKIEEMEMLHENLKLITNELKKENLQIPN
uniref:FYVE-type domain-containing protein n=1 Tax=Parastrongyloides trichosuri TaxID=131310 RepID=A0A0N4Z043_PARTI